MSLQIFIKFETQQRNSTAKNNFQEDFTFFKKLGIKKKKGYEENKNTKTISQKINRTSTNKPAYFVQINRLKIVKNVKKTLQKISTCMLLTGSGRYKIA